MGWHLKHRANMAGDPPYLAVLNDGLHLLTFEVVLEGLRRQQLAGLPFGWVRRLILFAVCRAISRSGAYVAVRGVAIDPPTAVLVFVFHYCLQVRSSIVAGAPCEPGQPSQ